jgi:hypothetical protein
VAAVPPDEGNRLPLDWRNRFHHSGSYATRFDPTDYDVRLDYSIWWRGRTSFANNYGKVAKKRDGGRCFAENRGEPPPGISRED